MMLMKYMKAIYLYNIKIDYTLSLLCDCFIVVKSIWAWSCRFSFNDCHFHVLDFDSNQKKINFANYHIFQMVPKIFDYINNWFFHVKVENLRRMIYHRLQLRYCIQCSPFLWLTWICYIQIQCEDIPLYQLPF